MSTLFDRRAALSAAVTAATPDAAFAAAAPLAALRDTLARAASPPGRWNEPPVFFFDPIRQAELEAARPAAADPLSELTAGIGAQLPTLIASAEVRRVARATAGLPAAARALAPRCPAARDLADLLAVPDDEVFLALAPADRVGVRLHVRGAASVAQLHRLLAPALGMAEGEFQLFAPAALRPDGTLPNGIAGCGHWLWPTQPLAAVPRVGGERVVLVGPATVRAAHGGGGHGTRGAQHGGGELTEPRFPGLAVECETLRTLNAFQTAGELSRLYGRPVPVQVPSAGAAVARAA